MRSEDSLQSIKSVIDNTYNRFGRQLIVNTAKKFDPDNPELGYCFKYVSPDNKNFQIYKIVCSQIGDNFADFRVLMHEYGHIYLAHLDGIHEDLDNKLVTVCNEERDELIEQINKSCGIDFAEKLINRVIDDPVLNHSLHNIAMDMEVNSKILSLEDVDEMEKRITEFLPKYNEEYLKYVKDNTKDEETRKKIDKALNKMQNESKIKLIHPSRYYLSKDVPFPDNLSYPEYLILLVKHLDQFVKMLVSIKKGGNGDTSQVTQQDIQDALQGGGQGGNGQGQGQGNSPGSMDYSNSSGGGMQGLDNLMEEMGMSDGQGGNGQGQGQDQQGQDSNNGNGSGNDSQTSSDSPYKGIRDGGAASDLAGDKDTPGGSHRDHRSTERDEADEKRKLGQIDGHGGSGCGNSGGPGATRMVNKNVDEVDMALEEVIRNFNSKIIEIKTKKDMMYLWNRGIHRNGLIIPSYRRKYDVKTNPTITFLIDISGSMDTRLVDRILKSISQGMRRIGRGLKYNIITWSTCLGEHLKDLDARKPVPRISMGGGTEMAGGMRFFKDNYGPESILILISDFEDYLEEWHKVEETMDGYTLYGFNYGSNRYGKDIKWKNFKVKNFKTERRGYGYY